MARITIFVILSLIFTIFYCLGLLMYLTDNGEDRCEMTYMFEYPQFVRIANSLDKKYPKYGLYAYSEGKFTIKARNMKFDGIPVLFIPGNAGSYRQVRSLSSVALRKSISDSTSFHFDYFTVDLNQELSGLYGPLLYDQLEYVNTSFYRIFELYNVQNKPNSIVLVGHSMGGIVAKNLLQLMSKPEQVSILITLATPLRRPALIADYYLQSFYEEVNKNILDSTTLISLTGGYRDFLIPPFLSRLKGDDIIYAASSSVPRSWVECNHVQILWCRQLILALSRALFDSVNVKTYDITNNKTYRDMVFHHHLIKNSGIKIRNYDVYSKKTDLYYKGKWIENIQKRYSVEYLAGLTEPHWHMVKLNILPGYEILNILAVNLDTVDWIYLCNANVLVGSTRVCTDGYKLTHLSEIVPSAKYKRRYFQTNLHELRRNYSELTHVVFRGLPTREPLIFHVDIHETSERDVTVDLPKWWSIQKHPIIERTAEKSIHYKLLLPQLYHVIQYFQLFVEPISCDNDNYHTSATLVTPWSNDKMHAYFTKTEKKPMIVRLSNSRSYEDIYPPFIALTLDPICKYRISVKSSFLGTLGQMARIYTPFLLTYVSIVVLMTLRFQLKSFQTGKWPFIFNAISYGAKPYYLLTLTRIMVQFFKGKLPRWFPLPDNWFLIDDGLDFLVLPLFLYMCGIGIVWMLSFIYFISLFTFESTVNKLMLKMLNRTFIWSNYLITFFHKIPAVVAVLLILLSTTTCGSLALCLGAIFYFMRLTQMSQDYVEEIMWFFVKKFARKFKKMFKRKSHQSQNSEKKKKKKKNVLGTSESNICDNIENKAGLTITKDEVPENDTDCENEALESEKTDIPDQEAETEQVNEKDIPVDNEDNKIDFEEVKESDNSTNDKLLMVSNKTEPDPDKKETVLSNFNPIFFHTSMFFLWCIITVINVPAILTWAHNFKYSKSLIPDTSFIPGVTLSVCALPLWQFDFPRSDRKWLENVEKVVFITAILCLVFATVSIYRLNYLLTFVFTIIILQQLFAPKEETVDGNGDDSDLKQDAAKEKYEDIKAKLD